MEKNFYEISAGGTMLREGSYLDIQRSLVYRGECADFTPFLNVPLKELERISESAWASRPRPWARGKNGTIFRKKNA